MFEMIITVCLIAGDGSIQCKVPASGLYLNQRACITDMVRAPDLVMLRLEKAGAPVHSVAAKCTPRGPTPKAS